MKQLDSGNIMQLRPYQTEAVAAVYDHLRQRDGGRAENYTGE